VTEACTDKRLLLHGLLDGELDAANALELEAHLKACPGCAEELERIRELRRTLAAPGLRYAAPERLRARVGAALDAEARTEASREPPVRRRSALWRIAPFAVGGGMAALAASLALVLFIPTAPPTLQRELVSDHVRSLLAQHLTDVTTSDQHTVKPWFAGRVDYSPPVVDLKDQGFPLAGGRLDYVAGKVTAALVYRRRLHVINLFVRPAEGREGAWAGERDGYNLMRWRQGGLEFWAVSDLSRTELEQFRGLFEARTKG
jgi:anti-sigma factor RsiW